MMMQRVVWLLVIAFSCVYGDIRGCWQNQLASTVCFSKVNMLTGELSGNYTSAVGNAKGGYPLIGWISETPPVDIVSWTVYWNKNHANSITSWTGQYDASQNQIRVMWHLVKDHDAWWSSVLTGQDVFRPKK